ncbi:hypothetical protein M404DRAFT_715548 [Pisolithus tinctorius Marx 270]|uniref:Uncharacterized protein n=1 Tax=Pisolithus tinctorius Marx 270 TaxID=870435 RepID=A0A0C3IZF3_PISTI|nr:hypothetical protein M404DRAFT_715548 [Pisolithus tinctorius Marx 270]
MLPVSQYTTRCILPILVPQRFQQFALQPRSGYFDFCGLVPASVDAETRGRWIRQSDHSSYSTFRSRSGM